jgi:hypothetical protein
VCGLGRTGLVPVPAKPGRRSHGHPTVVTPVMEGVAASEGITTPHHGGESNLTDPTVGNV